MSNTKNAMQTYLHVPQNEENNSPGDIEFDLIFMREKGQAQQFMEISISGILPDTSNPSTMRKIIASKEDFEVLKKYFSQLTWESL